MGYREKTSKRSAFVTAASCALLYGFVIGLGSNCQGLFFSVMAEGLGVSLSAVTRYLTFYGVSGAVCLPLFTRFFLRVPARLSLPFGVLLYALSVFFQGSVQSTAALYALGALRGVFGGFLATYPMQYIIGNWFPEKKGTVLGLAVMSAGLVGMLFNPVIEGWIQAFGWRKASRITGLLLFTIPMTAALLLKKAPREQAGSKAPATTAATEKEPAAEEVGENGKIRSAALFAVIALMVLIDLLTGLPQLLPSLAENIGKSTEFGALLVSAAMLGNISFKLFLGFLNDRIGTSRTTVFALLPMTFSALLLALVHQNLLLLLAAFLSGALPATYAIHYSLLFRQNCPPRQFGKLYGYICAMNSLLGSSSATVLSAIYTASGSFVPAMWFCVAALLLCWLLFVSFLRRK